MLPEVLYFNYIYIYRLKTIDIMGHGIGGHSGACSRPITRLRFDVKARTPNLAHYRLGIMLDTVSTRPSCPRIIPKWQHCSQYSRASQRYKARCPSLSWHTWRMCQPPHCGRGWVRAPQSTWRQRWSREKWRSGPRKWEPGSPTRALRKGRVLLTIVWI